jgi:hypothetical protein
MTSEPTPQPNRPDRWRRWLWLTVGVTGLGLLGAGALWWGEPRKTVDDETTPVTLRPDAPAFDSFESLKDTVVVPTLDTPFPQGKSAVWCSSFQIAWNRFRTGVVKEPVCLEGAEAIADRLNSATASDDDLAPESYYAAAGAARDGILERIAQEVSQKFPDAPRPRFGELPGAALVAFAYLQAAVKYTFEYYDHDEPLIFTDSAGKTTHVRSFGVRERDEHEGEKTFRAQIRVGFRNGSEYALDLCKFSRPYQVVLARLDRKDTLLATLTELREKLERTVKVNQRAEFSGAATLFVPTMHWRIDHRFRELENKPLLNPLGGYFASAQQTIQFKLDRRGAEVRSSGGMAWLDGDPPDQFRFDKPFLLYLKKRGGKQPFFVMWVDNAELLQRF